MKLFVINKKSQKPTITNANYRAADCDQPLRRSHPSIVWRRRWSVAYS